MPSAVCSRRVRDCSSGSESGGVETSSAFLRGRVPFCTIILFGARAGQVGQAAGRPCSVCAVLFSPAGGPAFARSRTRRASWAAEPWRRGAHGGAGVATYGAVGLVLRARAPAQLARAQQQRALRRHARGAAGGAGGAGRAAVAGACSSCSCSADTLVLSSSCWIWWAWARSAARRPAPPRGSYQVVGTGRRRGRSGRRLACCCAVAGAGTPGSSRSVWRN